MAESDQFAAHAERFRADADAATLANVRDRNLRAAAAWDKRAATARLTEAARTAREAATAAAREERDATALDDAVALDDASESAPAR